MQFEQISDAYHFLLLLLCFQKNSLICMNQLADDISWCKQYDSYVLYFCFNRKK